MTKPELLAPAGNLEKLKIAFSYGADAVYLGFQRFGLRSGADNFTLSDLAEARRIADRLGKRIYLTVNSYLHDFELADLPEFLGQIKDFMPDAIIVGDLGVATVIRRHTDTPFHISTQASVINVAHAKAYKALGVKRIVVGRELSLAEAASLKNEAGVEVEMFLHGALCMSYSGQCTISNYQSARDANRGGCVQSCRHHYRVAMPEVSSAEPEAATEAATYFMSSKDLKGLSLLKEFVHFGINSLKIEGRMKTALYLATATRAYRAALDELFAGAQVSGKWEAELEKVPHRGYTTGFLDKEADGEDTYDTDRQSTGEYEMAGQVVDVDLASGRFAMLCKNRLYQAESIELMTFCGQVVDVSLSEMQGLEGNDLTLANPGQIIWLSPPASSVQAEALMVARKKVVVAKAVTLSLV